MRKLNYLSPTAVDDWGPDGDVVKRSEFYLKRLAEHRPPKLPQTIPMAVGSAFDAFVKSYLHFKLYGNYGKIVEHKIQGTDGLFTKVKGPEFDLKLLLDVQVEPQNREQAYIDGQRCLDLYRSSGTLSDLLIEMQQAQGDIRFEATVEANVSHESMVCEVPILGKPDLSFFTLTNMLVIFDWKVNGYYAKSMKSPAKGYIKCRDTWDYAIAKPSRGTVAGVAVHKDVMLKSIGGITINSMLKFENVNEKFARQLTMYGWVLGSPVGADFVIGIEQLCGKPHEPGKPLLRIASHRGMVSQKYQFELALQVSTIWDLVQKKHIFNWLSEDESAAKCLVLDQYYTMYENNDNLSEKDKKMLDWFRDNTRPVQQW